MDTLRTLLLLRHAETESFAPGRRDAERRLTPRGHGQARELGDWLRRSGLSIDHVVCSPATRTQQTLEDLQLDPSQTSVELSRALNEAGSDTVLQLIVEMEESVTTALLIGHAPGIPSAVHALADPTASDRAALATVDARYPPTTLAVLEVRGSWTAPSRTRLASVRVA